MKRSTVVLLVAVASVAVLSGQLIGRVQAQPANSRPAPPQPAVMMTSPRAIIPGQMMQQMPTGQMVEQMQRQMSQMNVTIKALRAQLDSINPDLLTSQERPLYEYLKLLQTHLETMHGMMGTMMQMPGMMGR